MADTQPALGLGTLGRYGINPDGGFDERFFASYAGNHGGVSTPYEQYAGRLQRYNVFWRLYENNVYRRVNRGAEALKEQYGLYSAIRNVYCPAYRLVEFWAGHLLAGALDPEAGSGKERPSALPVLIPERGTPGGADEVARQAALRKAIARVWRENWQTNKDICSRFGAALGDVAIQVVDDPGRRQVYLKVIHPRIIRDITKDSRGNVKGYVFQEPRPDPRETDYGAAFARMVTYTEVASRQGESVVYETYLDGELYDWRDYPDAGAPRVGPTWTEDYGFIPLVVIQHRNMGLDWGISELFAGLSKLHELDDLASMLGDQIRKVIIAPGMVAGASAPGSGGENDLQVEFGEDDDPSAVREKYPLVYAPDANTKFLSLVGSLDIPATAAYVASILAEVERDHPELQADMATASGDASGRALRVARERVEAMVADRRVAYDDPIRRVTQMAIHIGAMQGKRYDPAFEPFNEESYARGDLDFAIGDRPVFAVDEADRIEVAGAKAIALKGFIDSGVPLEVALIEVGYDETRARAIVAMRDAEADKAIERQGRAQGLFLAEGDPEAETDAQE